MGEGMAAAELEGRGHVASQLRGDEDAEGMRSELAIGHNEPDGGISFSGGSGGRAQQGGQWQGEAPAIHRICGRISKLHRLNAH